MVVIALSIIGGVVSVGGLLFAEFVRIERYDREARKLS